MDPHSSYALLSLGSSLNLCSSSVADNKPSDGIACLAFLKGSRDPVLGSFFLFSLLPSMPSSLLSSSTTSSSSPPTAAPSSSSSGDEASEIGTVGSIE